MRRTYRVMVLSAIGAAWLWTGSPASAQLAPVCNAQTIKGTYGFQMDATFPNGAKVAAIGVFTFDGATGWTSADTTNFKGTVTQTTITGTYTVNRDCTGSASYEWAPGVGGTVHFVIVDNGKELLATESGPAATILIAKRQ